MYIAKRCLLNKKEKEKEMNKKNYELLFFKVDVFASEDVITTSTDPVLVDSFDDFGFWAGGDKE